MPLVHSSLRTRAVIFDFDGTLVDSAPSMTRALNMTALGRGREPVEVASVKRWISLGGEAMLRGALGPATDVTADLEELRELLRGQTADPADLYPGVIETLARLKADGYLLGVCTNKREDIAIRYAKGVGIAEYLDTVVGGAPDRLLKPHPDLALMTMDQLGAGPGCAIFVGDSEIDSETAAAVGLPFVLVTFGYPHGDTAAINAQARIDSVGELPRLVESMLG